MRLCSICHWKELLLSFKMSYLASKSRWAKFFKIFINTLILSSDDPKSRSIWGGAVIFKINFLSCYGVYSQTETIIVTRKPWRNFLGVALFQKKILKNLHRALNIFRLKLNFDYGFIIILKANLFSRFGSRMVTTRDIGSWRVGSSPRAAPLFLKGNDV